MADKLALPLSISLSSDIEPRQGVVDAYHASLQRRHFGNGAGARGEARPTARATRSWSVCTTYPRSAGRTDVTVVFARTGAAVSLA
jgi:hypothetical protein